MLNETDSITIICDSCGVESQQQIRRLRARIGQNGLMCSACWTPINDYSEQLERVVVNDGCYPFDKIKLHRA